MSVQEKKVPAQRTGGAGGRDESPEERADRRWGELIQEVRVAQTGVQILLAFLLSAVFAPGFEELGPAEKRIYVVTVILGAGATAALIAPVTLHRILSGQRLKPEAVEWASRLTVVGLILLLCTVMCAMFLILWIVLDHTIASFLTAGLFAWFALCWVGLPLWARHTRDA